MRFDPPRPRSDDERILPLINVVFLLLIFFMLTGRLAAGDPFKVEPPRSATEGPAAAQEAVVLLGADGRLALDGLVMERPALAEAVAGRLRQEPDTPIRLKADGRAEATAVVEVMELLRDAGAAKLQLLTVPEAR
ncbi:outer membrane transport energization protein ExbD [Tistlia consotensis]|uniref:Outer membrane transport energization protein ExbD n=1 Tax=Tistlia consotensis USBA 355 TaxID=560819 RepID=A0A1Y6BSQ8_9PROT|nr:biopolymer transporter ExbD [Tistlia consotensis]SMF19326.1 outer membrane transport energization protein ExbD [Tistlia consotensis USBA 355]SNR39037.1 outer membrane transport energization protein ExbD [Tistlia consotensis]